MKGVLDEHMMVLVRLYTATWCIKEDISFFGMGLENAIFCTNYFDMEQSQSAHY